MHYTLQSGRRTDTITSRCPACLKITHHTEKERKREEGLSDEEICCSEACYKEYLANRLAIFEEAQIYCYGKLDLPVDILWSATKIIKRWMEDIGTRKTH